MQMEPDEIRRLYRDAADKRKELTILAELNMVTETVMRRHLLDLGEEDPYSAPQKGRGRRARSKTENDTTNGTGGATDAKRGREGH